MSITKCLSTTKNFLKLITVEPTMIFYMMAFMVTNVVEEAFFVFKACSVNHGFNSTICDNINEKNYSDFNKKVQVTVSEFHQWNDIAGHVGAIIMAFFMGSWADRRGRKLPLLLGLFGKLYYSSMVVLNAFQDHWPVEYIVYTATLPMAFTGADVAIFAACFTYITDVSSQETRTFRVTILEVCYLATVPTGIALGSFLFRKVTNQSYSIMFIINCSLMVISILYSFIRLEWRTSEKQRPLREANNIFTDFFDYRHVLETFHAMFKRRTGKNRCYLLILIICMAFFTFQRSEKQMMYLYLQLVLNWNFEQISNFRTYQSALQDIALLTIMPLMSNFMHWKDSIIAIIGAIAHSVARVFFAVAEVDYVIYLGGIFAGIGPVIGPVIRSVVSKLVSSSERGKIFSILAVADNATPIIAGTAYNQVYKRTIEHFPSAMYFVTIATQLVVLVIFLFIHISSKNGSQLFNEKDEENDEDVNQKCIEQSNERS